MVDEEGQSLGRTVSELFDFIGDLPIVAYNADFDMRFLRVAANRHNRALSNPAVCALAAARSAWPDLKSHKLKDLAKHGKLTIEGTHRALVDCKTTLLVYSAAVSVSAQVGRHAEI
jgi:DNA polymerase III subunit epsilon